MLSVPVVGYGGDLGYLERVVLGGLFGGVGLIGRLAPGGVVSDGRLLALSGVGGGRVLAAVEQALSRPRQSISARARAVNFMCFFMLCPP